MYDKFMKKKHWKKTFLVMRLSCFLACWLTLSAFGTVFSQQKLVNLKVVAESLSNVLMQIKDQTGVKILYNENLLKNYENINLDLNNVEVEEALRQVLANTRFEYEVTDGVIVVKEKKNSFPQQKTVRIQGKVSDEDGAPLPGVTVLIKGTTLGTATDMDGKYSLSVPEGNYILLFTMVGMKTQEVTLKNQTELNIIMQHETSEMDEVVITGYFNQAKNSFTGAARTITAEELQAGGNQNILSALQNIDPSFVKLENNQLGSNPNAIPDFQIRGAGSISGMRDEYSGNPNMPVFIVDGFETTAEKVFDMDPYRVATITLLKDAAATAIYGSRASNGVVVITTTAPASGKMAVSYNGDATFYMADLSAYNLCNPEEKLELEVLAGLYDVEKKQYFNYGSKFADQAVMQRAYNWRLANIREGVNTYWLDKPLNSLTVAHKHSLRLDGGNDYRWVLSIPFFISCIRQQNPLTVLSKIILRKVKQFNLPPQKKMRDFCIFEDTPRLFLLGNRQFTFIAHNLDVAEDVVGQICHRHIRLCPYNPYCPDNKAVHTLLFKTEYVLDKATGLGLAPVLSLLFFCQRMIPTAFLADYRIHAMLLHG